MHLRLTFVLSRIYISIIGLIIGLAILSLTELPQFNETATIIINGQEALQERPNKFILYVGWFLTTFMTLHIFPPDILQGKIKNIPSEQPKKNGL